MEVFCHAAGQMLILFVLLLAGVIARRCKLMNDRFDTMLSALVMNIALPGMILSSVLGNGNLPTGHIIVELLVCSALCYIMILLIAEAVPRLLFRRDTRATRGVHSFIIAFGNVGFIGFPVLSSIFGPEAVFYGAVYNIPYNILMFSIGSAMIRRGSAGQQNVSSAPSLGRRVKDLARTLATPVMAASIVSVVLALFHITDEGGIIGQSCSYLGQLTVPASMLIIGSSLAQRSLKSMLGHLKPYVSSLFRLLVIPVCVWFAFHFFIEDSLVLGVLTMSSAMPVASMGVMLCLVHGSDMDTMTRGTFITTILSILTIPLVALLVA